jgi:hypothetical protein
MLPTFDLGQPLALSGLAALLLFIILARFSRRGMRVGRARIALGVRLFVATLLILALADPRVRVPADRLAVGFLIDVSDSVPDSAREAATAAVRAAIDSAPAGDASAVIAFAGDAFVERPASAAGRLDRLSSTPPRGSTNLAAALRVGLGTLPTDRARRLVLISDGNENRERAREEVRVATAAGVPVDTFALGETRGPEVLVRGLEAPGALREGDSFALRLSLESTVETSVRVLLLTDGRLAESGGGALTAPIALHPGANAIVLPHDPLTPGFHIFRIQIQPGIDTIVENNEAVAFTTVSGRPRVLVIEGQRGESRFIVDALKAGGIEATAVPPIGLPTDLTAMRAWDGVVLVNVSAAGIAGAQMRTLKAFVQTLGGGLTIVGGERSYVLGAYQRTALEEMAPVSMQRRGARAQSSVALTLVIEIGRAHV